MPYCVALATTIDLEVVASILREAATWLASTGKEMWRAAELSDDEIAADIQLGRYWVARCEQQHVGVVRFQLEDPTIWPEIDDDRSAFIHRLAVRRHWAGQGVSTALLDFARERSKSLGKTHLRLDCAADRPALRRIYERYGFSFHSHLQAGPWYVARYELRL